jgi:two-component system response regulator NreC
MFIRIFVVEGNSLMREGICSVLSRMEKIEEISKVRTVEEAVVSSLKKCPDLAIINLASLGEEGYQIAKELHRYNRRIGIIGLFGDYENLDIIRLVGYGASACLSVDCEPDELINAVEVVCEGGSLLNSILMPVIADIAGSNLTNKKPASDFGLTSREEEILQMIIDGKSVKKIADHLDLSIHTIYTHKRNIREKLNASNDVELIKNAMSKKDPAKRGNGGSVAAA